MNTQALLPKSRGEGSLTVPSVVKERFCLPLLHQSTLRMRFLKPGHTLSVTRNMFLHLCGLVCPLPENLWLIGGLLSYWFKNYSLNIAVVLNLFWGSHPLRVFLKLFPPFQMYINNPYQDPLLCFRMHKTLRQFNISVKHFLPSKNFICGWVEITNTEMVMFNCNKT